jgi:hypothetical protein
MGARKCYNYNGVIYESESDPNLTLESIMEELRYFYHPEQNRGRIMMQTKGSQRYSIAKARVPLIHVPEGVDLEEYDNEKQTIEKIKKVEIPRIAGQINFNYKKEGNVIIAFFNILHVPLQKYDLKQVSEKLSEKERNDFFGYTYK